MLMYDSKKNHKAHEDFLNLAISREHMTTGAALATFDIHPESNAAAAKLLHLWKMAMPSFYYFENDTQVNWTYLGGLSKVVQHLRSIQTDKARLCSCRISKRRNQRSCRLS